MVSQAETIKNLIETNWSFVTGNLSKTPTDDMKEIVRFFDRPQVLGNEWPKAVEVVKINDEEEENVIDHPNFIEIEDIYEITLRYRVRDVQTQYDQSLTDIELMATELLTILDAQYDPSGASAEYFISNRRWRKEDHVDQAQPELKRILWLRLTQIKGQSDSVFRGNSAVMIFNNAESSGDSKPGANYTFTEIKELSIIEGFPQRPYLTKDKGRGRGVPHLVRGWFVGVFSSFLFAKRADIDGTTLDKIENIYQVTTATSGLNSQVGEVVFLHNTKNTEAVTETFTTKSFMRISRVEKITSDEALVAYRLVGNLTQPSEVTMAP